MINRLAALALTLLVACAPVQRDSALPTRAASIVQDLPPMRAFAPAPLVPPKRSNAEIARDFLDLSFRMESGKELPFMTRFEGPITVRLTGETSDQMLDDLHALLTRLRREAGINILMTNEDDASITVEAIPLNTLQGVAPRAACFVVPRVESWAEFSRKAGTSALDWSTLERRERASVFIPSDAAPQEVRDCLHEELAQAIGPLNDLYRLPDSIFNDDNIHTVLTGFDMLILRAYYAPEMRNGMTEAEALEVIPTVLARLNPAGRSISPQSRSATSREWIDAMATAVSSGSSQNRRRRAAQSAIAIGTDSGWSGPRQGFAYYAYGRLEVANDPQRALRAFDAAEALYRQSDNTDIHAAHIAVQKAAFTLASGDTDATLALTNAAIPVAEQHQNAALLSTLMMFKAEALDMGGNNDAADAVRLDSLGWARYGFGSDRNVQARLAEVASLRPF